MSEIFTHDDTVAAKRRMAVIDVCWKIGPGLHNFTCLPMVNLWTTEDMLNAFAFELQARAAAFGRRAIICAEGNYKLVESMGAEVVSLHDRKFNAMDRMQQDDAGFFLTTSARYSVIPKTACSITFLCRQPIIGDWHLTRSTDSYVFAQRTA